ncbi:MAG TPA: class I SAM-dependent methyltransferase [Terriglobia bacterium]|nr:class I SAM-dependent methyltransferase [Terriglobia bacterium]
MRIFQERLFKLRNEPHALQRFVLRRYLFTTLERLGIHAVGDHFYEPIPNLVWLEKHYDDSQKFFPASSDWDFSAMEQRALAAIATYGGEFREEADKRGYRENCYFQKWDALCLYTYLRSNKIRCVVEIGQGFSTLVTLAALGRNRRDNGIATRLISIDPYARADSQQSTLDRTEATVIRQTVQDTGAAEILPFLGDDCLLFVDSSHVFKVGSDVEFLQKKVYPLIPSGCHLHVHDIYSPYPWPRENYVSQKWFWNEQELLEQFLAFNSQFSMQLAAYWLFKESSALKLRVAEFGPDYAVEGTSLYLRRH